MNISRFARSAFLAGALSLTASAVTQPVSAQQASDIVPGRYIVIFDRTTLPGTAAANLGRAHGFQVRHVYSRAINGMAIQFPAGAAEAGILTALRRDPRVLSIGADLYAHAITSDFETDGLNRIHGGFYNAGVPSTGAGVTVAVFDSGLDFNHRDLDGNILIGLSRNCLGGGGCTTNNGGGQDDNGHGTFVGGIIAAEDNGQDIVGVAHGVKLIAVKVLDENGSGPFTDIIAGLQYIQGLNEDQITTNDVQVANMSLGLLCSVCTDDSTHPTVIAFHTAVDALVNAGVTLVVAAGNDNADAAFDIPASFDSVVTVSALADWDGQPGGNGGGIVFTGLGRQKDDTFAKFSNYGADVDVIAPGFLVTSLILGDTIGNDSGTSFSAPYVAGVAAAYIGAGGSPLPADVRNALIETGECHEGAGSVFHDGAGCAEIWPNDKDGIGEPMVRADNIASAIVAPPAVVTDVAVTSVAVDTTPIIKGDPNSVSVVVANMGTTEESITVTLTDTGAAVAGTVGAPQLFTIAAGGQVTRSFTWDTTDASTDEHTLTASHGLVDSNDTNDSATTTAIVQTPLTDVAVLSVTAPETVNQGDIIDVMVVVKNMGTTDPNVTVTLTDTGAKAGTVSVEAPFTILAGDQVTLTFTWDTTGASTDEHTLAASHDLVDANAANDSASTTSTVSVPVAGPTVAGIDPATMSTNSSVGVTITGSGFMDGATVAFTGGSGSTPAVSNVSVFDGKTITATVTVKKGGPSRNRVWNVLLTNPDGSSDTLLDGFTVTP